MAFVDPKPKRTAKGEAYRVRWTDPAGRDREKWVYGKRAAQTLAKTIDADLLRGQYVDDRLGGKRTFREVAEDWLGTRTNPKPETVARYRRILESDVYPTFGDRQVASIKPADVGRFVNDLKTRASRRGGPLRPASIRHICWPLHAVLDYAVEHDYLRRNPAHGVRLPDAQTLNARTFEARALSPAEVERVAAEAVRIEPMYGLVVRLLADAGLRAAEFAGLNVGDVTLLGQRGTLAVRRTRTKTPPSPAFPDGWKTYEQLKTRRSRRTIDLAPSTVAALAAHLAAHPRRAEPDAPLFPGRTPGGEHSGRRRADPFDWSKPADPGTFYKRVFTPACTRAGVGHVRLHDLRHTSGSLYLAAGVPLERVSRRLGHSSVAMTESVYMHTYATSTASDAAALDAYYQNSLGRDNAVVRSIRRA